MELIKTLVNKTPEDLFAISDSNDERLNELWKNMLGSTKETSSVQLAQKFIIPWASTSFVRATALSLKQIVMGIALIATRILLIPSKLYNGKSAFEPILIGAGFILLGSLDLSKSLFFGFMPGMSAMFMIHEMILCFNNNIDDALNN